MAFPLYELAIHHVPNEYLHIFDQQQQKFNGLVQLDHEY
jgi:hypothetical protein